MHVMFIHPAFPAQFGHLADYMAREMGWSCTFVTSVDTTYLQLPFVHINYRVKPGPLPKIFYPTGRLEDGLEHMNAVYRGLKSAPQIQPDLVVGHMFFGTLLFLKVLYKCPFIGYFEWMPPPFWSPELAQRMDYPPPDDVRLCQALDHSLTLLHLRMVDAAYTPTEFQYSISPPELRHKVTTIHDGIDTEYYKRREIPRPTSFRGIPLSPDTKIVTYVSPGLESWRGFDIFMKMAKRICDQRNDVIFLIAGEERTQYGYELNHIGPQSFKQYVLSQDNYDLSRFHFLGIIPTQDLVTLFSLSDMHVYLTIPFVLSWSLMQAMSAGCTILSSATPPVMEMIEHRKHGLLSDFYDVDTMTRHAMEVLSDPEAYRHLGVTARKRILEKYEKAHCIRQMVKLFESVTNK